MRVPTAKRLSVGRVERRYFLTSVSRQHAREWDTQGRPTSYTKESTMTFKFPTLKVCATPPLLHMFGASTTHHGNRPLRHHRRHLQHHLYFVRSICRFGDVQQTSCWRYTKPLMCSQSQRLSGSFSYIELLNRRNTMMLPANVDAQ